MAANTVFELKNVGKVYKADKEADFEALRDINLEIYEGEIFGIIGMSGAGKSTLVRTLNRLEDVTSGEVNFYGENLAEMNGARLRQARQSISMIFQNFNLLTQKTVLENVMLPLKIAGVKKSKRKEIALEMLQVVGLADKAKAYPLQLSGGQRQRVAIARALTNNPKVLLCDEATSALDPKMTEEILNLLQEINRTRKLTVVIITHEMSVVEKICDRVAILDDGNLAEIGKVTDIFTKPTSKAAKTLVFPNGIEDMINPFDRGHGLKRLVRIAFDGTSCNEPFIASLVEETGKKVNILSANTKSVNGIGYGQMVLELPEDETDQQIVLSYFTGKGLSIVEVEEDD